MFSQYAFQICRSCVRDGGGESVVAIWSVFSRGVTWSMFGYRGALRVWSLDPVWIKLNQKPQNSYLSNPFSLDQFWAKCIVAIQDSFRGGQNYSVISLSVCSKIKGKKNTGRTNNHHIWEINSEVTARVTTIGFAGHATRPWNFEFVRSVFMFFDLPWF